MSDLTKRIEAFVADKRESDGNDSAPVEDGDIKEFYGIIGDIIKAKWEEDCDGDIPVDALLTDLTKHQRLTYRHVPHVSSESTEEEMECYENVIDLNLECAHRDVSGFFSLRHHVYRNRVKTLKRLEKILPLQEEGLSVKEIAEKLDVPIYGVVEDLRYALRDAK